MYIYIFTFTKCLSHLSLVISMMNTENTCMMNVDLMDPGPHDDWSFSRAGGNIDRVLKLGFV